MKDPLQPEGQPDESGAGRVVPVDRLNVRQAAAVHAFSWQASHRAVCSGAFLALHTPERQEKYLLEKMDQGSRVFLLLAPQPAGIVSVRGGLIEDLYVLPECQGRGYGTRLLRYAAGQCEGAPTLWILENNARAAGLYRKEGFRETGARRVHPGGVDEIEMRLR